jgi:hypothetical protein
MGDYPWFRVYNEVLTDRKLERIRSTTGIPRVVIRGVWLTLLAMANDSPKRGCLLWAEGIPVTEDELCADLEIEHAVLDSLLACFQCLKMIHRNTDVAQTGTSANSRAITDPHPIHLNGMR